MKKLLAIILMLVMAISLVGCSMLPDDIAASIEDFKNNIFGTEPDNNPPSDEPVEENPQEEPVHVCEFFTIQKIFPSCTEDGLERFKCECGKSKSEAIPALGHAWGDMKEASRFIFCSRLGCKSSKLYEGNGKYAEALKFTFGDEDKAVLAQKHDQLSAILAAADAYDPTLHAFSEEGALAEEYEAAEAIYEEYDALIYEAQGQYSIAMTLYYCDNQNKELEQIYNDMMEYYNELVSKFYSLSQPWYDSKFREFFFYGATEEEINAFLFDSNAYANPEYTALKSRNDAIELEFYNIANPVSDPAVCELYAEFVENNNKIAEILGYDNYLEYAYENVYNRDYTYQDVAVFVEYLREYVAPIYNAYYDKFKGLSYSNAEIEEYSNIVGYSFFENYEGNEMFNNYIDDMNMAFTSNPDKQISFSDNLNSLMSDGNLFKGTYEGAYVTSIRGEQNIPIAYFGHRYNNSMTVAHEFGHYMNEVYNMSAYSQSYDLLEVHSQGQEMLYLYYIDTTDKLSNTAYAMVETEQILNALYSIMCAAQVDCFERAIYLNSYDGPNSDIIMADGKITADEYDLLYSSLSEYLGIEEKYQDNTYWRYGMTITSACYYISYSVSATAAIQIYAKAHTESFDAAKESYLELFTYTDANPDMTVEEILSYADLMSYNDENLYILLNEFFMSRK